MSKKLIRGTLSLMKWALCVIGAAALLLSALVATPLEQPSELRSVSESRNGVDFSTLPPVERFQARDGTMLGFRHYLARGMATGRGAVFIHGSSGSSGTANHALTAALAARGVETWAADIRGHGASGTRGDIAYVGQLEDDLADFVAHPQDRARSAADADRPFRRWRLRASRCGVADAEPVRPHRAAGALSGL
jgi:hypothetical protein